MALTAASLHYYLQSNRHLNWIDIWKKKRCKLATGSNTLLVETATLVWHVYDWYSLRRVLFLHGHVERCSSLTGFVSLRTDLASDICFVCCLIHISLSKQSRGVVREPRVHGAWDVADTGMPSCRYPSQRHWGWTEVNPRKGLKGRSAGDGGWPR